MGGSTSDHHRRKTFFRPVDSLSRLFVSAQMRENRREGLFSIFKSIRTWIHDFIRNYPAVVMLLACIPAALSFLPGFGMPFCYLCVLLFSAVVLYADSPSRVLFLVILPAFCVTISAQHARPGIETNPLVTMTGHDTLHAVVRLKVTDSFASEQVGIDFRQKELECRLISLHYPGDEEEFMPPRDIKLLLNLTKYTGMQIAYGDILEAEGVFRPVAEPIFSGSFDYKRYLALQQIHEFFYPDKLTIIQSGKGVLRTLFRIRDGILRDIGSQIDKSSIRAVATGMLFGRKTNIPRTTKELFLRSGMIHILTVSGTHVMIVAGLLLLLFAPLKTNARYICTICAIFPYVVMTGLHGSSMRAFTMLAMVLILRAFSATVKSFNSLAIAGTILLLADPASVLKSGMHYSFLSVFLLLLYARFQSTGCLGTSSDYDKLLSVRKNISPFRIYARHILSNLKQGFMTSLMISIGTSALTLLYQGFLPVQGFLANCIAIPTAGFTFIFAGLTWIFHAVPYINYVCGTMLSLSIRAISFAGRICIESMPVRNLAAPPTITVILFLVLFSAILYKPQSRRLPLILSCLAIILIYWHITPAFLPREIVVISGGGDSKTHPSVVITEPALSRADIINLPDSNTAYAIMDFLASRGIGTCRIFAAATSRKTSYGGLSVLTDASFPILTTASKANTRSKMPPYPTRAIAFDKILPFSDFSDGTFSIPESSNKTDVFLFRYNKFHGSISPSKVLIEDNSGRMIFQTEIRNKSKYSFLLHEVSL